MTDIQWKSLTDEQYREYHFESGFKIKINKPCKLNVSSSGGHRILDCDGVSHYIPPKWVHLSWLVWEGRPEFAF